MLNFLDVRSTLWSQEQGSQMCQKEPDKKDDE